MRIRDAFILKENASLLKLPCGHTLRLSTAHAGATAPGVVWDDFTVKDEFTGVPIVDGWARVVPDEHRAKIRFSVTNRKLGESDDRTIPPDVMSYFVGQYDLGEIEVDPFSDQRLAHNALRAFPEIARWAGPKVKMQNVDLKSDDDDA